VVIYQVQYTILKIHIPLVLQTKLLCPPIIDFLEDSYPGEELDPLIIETAVQIEEHEIATYASVAETARALGYEGVAQRLYLTMEEERQSKTKLKFLQKSLFTDSAEIGEMSNEMMPDH
jgi:hypothetical protein